MRAKVTIVGTSHIAPASIEAARRTILRLRPDCVALELDPERWAALSSNMTRRPPLRNPMYWLLNRIQTSLGSRTGMMPGSEMLAAVDAARKVGARIVLIDMPITEVMRRLSAISLWERLKLFFRLLSGLVAWPDEDIDLTKAPPDRTIDEALGWMRKELPAFHRVLITDRNDYMAAWIRELSRQHKRMVVVAGAGHRKGLEKLLRNKNSRATKRGRA